MTSVREKAIFYVGRGGRRTVSTAGGGNVVLNAGRHALDGPEHSGQLPADRVSVEDTGGYFAGDDAEAVFQELGAADVALAAEDAALEAEIAALSAVTTGVWVPILASSPNVISTDGSAVFIPLSTVDGGPVMARLLP